jgi:amylosucrase
VWARRAKAGDPVYRAYYLTFPDREQPDAFEATVPQVFPETAPGSFTWDEQLQAWVWTSFHEYQWDLDYTNPTVFVEMLDVMLFLANRGVEILRLDAVPFTWKRLGTTCQNQPEAHRLLQAYRSLVRVAAPAVLFKAEAIVPPDELVPYLGAHDPDCDECDLAYHNQLMVMGWSSLASRDARLARHALSSMASPPPGTSWCTYVRCHDDIGWAVRDRDAAAVGWDGSSHRRFLAEFYSGRFPGTFALGADFQPNRDTGDVRTSGSTATLAGLETALAGGQPDATDRAVRRIALLHALAYSYGGIPLLYMGDELGQCDDRSYADEPAHVGDNRWLHRPRFDESAAATRHDPASPSGRVFEWLVRLGRTRASLPALTAASPATVLPEVHRQVLAYRRKDRRTAPFVAVTSFAEEPVAVPLSLLLDAGVEPSQLVLHSGPPPSVEADALVLDALSFAWFAA